MASISEAMDQIVYVGVGIFVLIIILALTYNSYALSANQQLLAGGFAYQGQVTTNSLGAFNIIASNTLTLTALGGTTAWISASNPLIVTVTGLTVGTYASSSVQIPNKIIFYEPITFTNSQATNVAASTPLMFTFNALASQAYETNTLNNTEIFYSNGTVANSFIEGNLLNEISNANVLYQSQNVIWWVQTPPTNTFLGASSSVTMYIGFAGNTPTSANNLWTGSVGTSFQLANTIVGIGTSTAKAEDSGANVFTSYINFGGLAALPVGWTKTFTSGTGIAFGTTNIIITSTQAGTDNGIFWSGANAMPISYNSPGYTIDLLSNWNGGITSTRIGLGDGTAVGSCPCRWLTVTGTGPERYRWFSTISVSNDLTPNAMMALTNMYSFSLTSPTTANVYTNYSIEKAIGTGSQNPLGVLTTNGNTVFSITTESSSIGTLLFYIRTHPNPPNNAMPSATFASPQSAFPVAGSSNSIVFRVTSTSTPITLLASGSNFYSINDISFNPLPPAASPGVTGTVQEQYNTAGTVTNTITANKIANVILGTGYGTYVNYTTYAGPLPNTFGGALQLAVFALVFIAVILAVVGALRGGNTDKNGGFLN